MYPTLVLSNRLLFISSLGQSQLANSPTDHKKRPLKSPPAALKPALPEPLNPLTATTATARSPRSVRSRIGIPHPANPPSVAFSIPILLLSAPHSSPSYILTPKQIASFALPFFARPPVRIPLAFCDRAPRPHCLQPAAARKEYYRTAPKA